MTPEFERIFSWGGTPQAMCCCGRIHYASGGDFMEEGELAALEAKRKEKPDRYIPTTDDSVGIADVFGVIYVWNCPCNWAGHMESSLWSRRRQIIAYYQARAHRELQAANETATALAGIQDDGKRQGGPE